MTIGFKTGPKNWEEGKRVVEEDGARMCEVWFRIDKAGEYNEMLAWLADHDVVIGLHHWGLGPDGYKTNLATVYEPVRQATIDQIKQTIDVAAQLPRMAYVNAHPGARYLERMDFERGTQELIEEHVATIEESEQQLLASASELYAYAQQRGVLLTLETLPAGEQVRAYDRSELYFPDNASLRVMKRVAQLGPIANDISHSAATIAHEVSDGEAIWSHLLAFTQDTSEATRLIHVNTIMPPHDGTDTHDGITDVDFVKGVFPTEEQMVRLLRTFKDRDDVYLVPEPREQTQENYRALQALAAQL